MTPAELAQCKFEKLVSPEPNTGCWIWLGTINDKKGYGKFQFKNVRLLAHRFSWIIYKGRIPDGLHVLHKCDCTYCVNPEHLFLGTIQDNNRDMISKKRNGRAIGELNGRSKITAVQAKEIRESSLSIKELVSKYGIGKSMVSYIRARVNWK